MNTSFDASMSDDDVLQDMEEQLYNPLPDGLVEQDWLDLPAIERDWLELPVIERDWLDLPAVEQEWLDMPALPEQDRVEQTLSDTLDFDLDI